MNEFENICLIFEDNPISRAYLEYYKRKNLTKIKIVYLKQKSLLPKKILQNLKFNKNNYYPIKFLKDKRILNLINQIEDFFYLDKNFLISMYNFNNLNYFKNIVFTKNSDINSKENVKFFSDIDDLNYLNTGKQILKEIFLSEKNFFHIHPGYLPKIRGADASLHGIKLYNQVGASLFKMNEQIDKGKIVLRIEKNYKKFLFNDFQFFSPKDLYRIWFSFVDPAIRVWCLNNVIEQKLKTNKFLDLNSNNEVSKYYSFLNENELKDLFKALFN